MRDRCGPLAGPMDRATFLTQFDADDDAEAHLAHEIGGHLAEDERVLGWVQPFDDLRRMVSKKRTRTVILTCRRFLLVDVHVSDDKRGRTVLIESAPTFLLRCVTTDSSVRSGACVQSSVRLDFSRPAFMSSRSDFGPPESVLRYAVDGPLGDEVRVFLAAVAVIARSTGRAPTLPQQ